MDQTRALENKTGDLSGRITPSRDLKSDGASCASQDIGSTIISARRPNLAKCAVYGLVRRRLASKTAEKFLQKISAFYFDLALLSSGEVVAMLRQSAKPGHILYGSDYPYV